MMSHDRACECRRRGRPSMWPRPELLTQGPSTSMMQEEERPMRKLAAWAAADLAESRQGKEALLYHEKLHLNVICIYIHIRHIYTHILVCMHLRIFVHISLYQYP